MKNIKIKISNFNKYLIFFICLLFLYIFYLSIPTLYNKEILQKELTEKLLDDFKINISLSSNIKYLILPSPHILVENAKFFDNNSKIPQELGQIKKLKIFISQKSLLDRKNLRIIKILMDNSNFSVKKKNLSFYKTLFFNRFSDKNIYVKNSNIFFKDELNDIILIIPISKLNLFYNSRNYVNQINANGEMFSFPFNIKWTRNFSNEAKSTTDFKIKKLKLEFKNISVTNKEKINLVKNILSISNSNIVSEYKIQNNNINIKSIESRLINNEISYNGFINLNPFEFKIDANVDKLNFKNFVKTNKLVEEFLKINSFKSKNLNGKIVLKINNLIKNNLLDSSNIVFNFNNGSLDFNKTIFNSKKIGSLLLYNSSMDDINGELIFKGNFNLSIKDQKQFYKIFQTSKKFRKPIKNIFFEIEINLFNDKIKVKNISIDNLKLDKKNEEIIQILDNFNSLENKSNNWIYIKKLTNDVLANYFG